MNLVGKYLKLNYSYGISYKGLKLNSINNLFSSNIASSSFVSLNSSTPNIEYGMSKYIFYTTFDSKLHKNGFINIGGSLSLGKEYKIDNVKNISLSSVFPNYLDLNISRLEF